jgi:hypothetical protein
MSGSQKVPVTISIDPHQLARLDQLAADLDRSRSWVASRAMAAFLAVTDSRSPAQGLVSDALAEPPGAGVVAASVPATARSMENQMSSSDNSRKAQNGPAGIHLQHLVRVQEAAKRQAADTQAERDAAMSRASEYIAKIGQPE